MENVSFNCFASVHFPNAHVCLIFKGKVVIIGAGPAGLSAGYHLHKMGVQVSLDCMTCLNARSSDTSTQHCYTEE